MSKLPICVNHAPVGLSTIKDRQWMLPCLTSLLCLFLLFCVVPYSRGYGLKPYPLWDTSISMWFGYAEWTHGVLVFPAIAWLVFRRRKVLANLPIRGSWWGLALLAVAVLVYWVGYLVDLQYVGYLAIQLFVAALVFWFWGTAYFCELFFCWLFLSFAWPLVFLDESVAFPLRLFMSQLSAPLLTILGQPAIRSGTAILSAPVEGARLGAKFSIDVADPCSGIHSLYALLMISAFYGLFALRRGWQVVLVTVAAIPLAVLGNLGRILLLAFGTIWFGETLAIGSETHPSWFHTAAGCFVYLVALAGILLLGTWSQKKKAA